MDELVKFAAAQLRAVATSRLSHNYSTDRRVEPLTPVLNESITDYVARVHIAYRGDVLCLWALSLHFQRAFRVWVPGCGSILIPTSRRQNPKDAFQLMILAVEVEGRPPAVVPRGFLWSSCGARRRLPIPPTSVCCR